MILSLVRHAETVVDPARDPADWPLSDSGRADAVRLAVQPCWRNISRLMSSVEPKAVQTARCISAASGVALETCPALNEVKRPTFRKDYIHRVEEFFRFPDTSCDDWETAEDALARVRSVIQCLDSEFAEGHVVLVGHGLMWALARAWLMGQDKVDPGEWRAMLMPDVSVWEIGPSGASLISDFEGMEAHRDDVVVERKTPCA